MTPEEVNAKKISDIQMARRVRVRNERIRLRRIAEAKNAPKKVIVPTTTTTTTPLPPIEGEMTLEICIHTFRYQRRLCWMLSSILQQKGDIPKIIINISHTDDDGDPTTEEVCKFFKEKGLNIKETKVTKEQVHNRAIARNMQTKATESHYLLFADSDMVYDPCFFADLKQQLKTNLSTETKVMGADRISLNQDFCIKYFEEDKRKYPCEVSDAAAICAKFPIKWITGKNTVPGNFQLASVKSIKNRGGVYTGRSRDYWRATHSDRGFRCQMGGRVAINAQKQFHLNHDRGGPEIQR
jgi:hypothetical protein